MLLVLIESMDETDTLERRKGDPVAEEDAAPDFSGLPIRIVAEPDMSKYLKYLVRRVDDEQLREFQQIVDPKLERAFIIKAPIETAGGFVEHFEVRDNRGPISSLMLTALKMSEVFHDDTIGWMEHAQYFFGRSEFAPAYAVKDVKPSKLLRPPMFPVSPLSGACFVRPSAPMEIYAKNRKMTGRCVMVPYGKGDSWGAPYRQGLLVGVTKEPFRFNGTPQARQRVLTARY